MASNKELVLRPYKARVERFEKLKGIILDLIKDENLKNDLEELFKFAIEKARDF